MKLKHHLLLLSIISVTACGPLEPLPDEPYPGESGTGGPIHETTQTREQRETMQQPTVVALLQKAESEQQRGQLGPAAANLERALRISPRDPVLYYKLAQLRLRQSRLQQAESLAFKSISYTREDDLKRQNWLLIYNVRQQQGDMTGAKEALDKSKGLE